MSEYYYPAGVSAISDYNKYVKTKEFKNLIKKLNNAFKYNQTEKDLLLREINAIFLNKEFKDYTSEINDKCYTLKIDFFENNLLYQIQINLSLLIPYYFIYVLKNEIQQNPYKWLTIPKRDKIAEKNKFQADIIELSNIIEKVTLFNKLPETIATDIIPNISYGDIDLGYMTYFKAFFMIDVEVF